ncbi:MAG: hypothetical protein NVS1B13_06240 [Flavisolibacter sp.]
MSRIVFILLASVYFLISCGQPRKETADILDNPPYDKLTDSISRAPHNPDLLFRRGGLLYSNNEKALAEADLRSAWQLDHREDYALSVAALLKQKQTDSAIAFLKTALLALPSSIVLKIGLARGYQQSSKLDSAMRICDQILQKFPNQLDALLLKSDILKEQNKNQEALVFLEKAYFLSPLDKELAYNLAYDYAQCNNPKALDLAEHLIKQDSTQTVARAYYIKASFYKNTGRLSSAIDNYNAALIHDYNFLDAYLDKGIVFYEEKKFEQAEATFQLALKVSPTTAEFYFWLGKTQEVEKKKVEARRNYQRAFGLDTSLRQAKQAADRL